MTFNSPKSLPCTNSPTSWRFRLIDHVMFAEQNGNTRFSVVVPTPHSHPAPNANRAARRMLNEDYRAHFIYRIFIAILDIIRLSYVHGKEEENITIPRSSPRMINRGIHLSTPHNLVVCTLPFTSSLTSIGSSRHCYKMSVMSPQL